MQPIKTEVTEELLKDLASRSNFRLGKDIAKNGAITFMQSDVLHMVARVEFRNSQTRTVDVLSTPKGIKWKCTCSSRKDLFCQHCVAVGLTVTHLNN